MKRFISGPVAILSLGATIPALAADLTLTDGRTFRDATVLSQTPRSVVIKHSDGLSGISKTLLTAELSSRYPIDEVAALEADRKDAETRVRSQEFHKAEAERSSRVRLEREQSALHNAQIAALEASQRLADAEAARVASQRSDSTYDYSSSYPSYFSPYYNHAFGSSYSSNCTPRWNESAHNNWSVRDDCSPRDDRYSNPHRSNFVQKLNNSQMVHHGHKQIDVPPISQAHPTNEERRLTRVAATVARR